MKQGAQLFAYLKQLLKMYTRQRDKAMMLSVIEEVSPCSHVSSGYESEKLTIPLARDPSTLP